MKVSPVLFVFLLTLPAVALAESYVVKTGDSLSSIAIRYGIPLETLLEANHLQHPDRLRAGMVLNVNDSEGVLCKGGVSHVVRDGVTLQRIARAYGVPLAQLARVNGISNPDRMRSGTRIFVPGARRVVPLARRRARRVCLSDPVEFYRVRTGETRRIVLTQCNGAVWEPGVDELSSFLDRTADQSAPRLEARLIRLVQQVAQRYRGRRLEIISAYRAPVGEQKASSRHCQARALDFRVAGISNSALRDFARSLREVGVGYYPNSTFVHLDVRDRNAFWVDWSGPGEPPRYGPLHRGRGARLALRASRRERPTEGHGKEGDQESPSSPNRPDSTESVAPSASAEVSGTTPPTTEPPSDDQAAPDEEEPTEPSVTAEPEPEPEP